MRRPWLAMALALALGLGWQARRCAGQAPTIDEGNPTGPGTTRSSMGVSPGANGSTLGVSPGAGGSPYGAAADSSSQPISGRVGPSGTRVPSSVSTPGGGRVGLPPQAGISAPQPIPGFEAPTMGTLSERFGPEDEGPPNGMTLDQAIDRLVNENLDLRSKYMEIPMSEADVLTASLRNNPVFYADSQLVPYGQYSNTRPGGPLQYDINVSIPIDASFKRRARIRSASRARSVLEAQYQDAVRLQIDNLYSAWTNVLAARLTLTYSEKSVSTWDTYLTRQQELLEKGGEIFRVDYNRILIQRNTAAIGLNESRANYMKYKRVLGTQLNLTPQDAESLEVRGTIRDLAPLPPPRDELIRIALEARPDINAFRLGVQRAEADVRLAMANRWQDWYLLYQPYTFQNNQPFGTKSATSYAVGLTVPLPILNRNQGAIQRAKLNVTQSQQELESLMRQVITDVQQAEWEYAVSRSAVQHIEQDLLPPARQTMYDRYKRWIGGEENVLYFLDAQREYNDIVKQYRDTVVRHRQAMLDLNTAVGVRLLP